MHKRLAFDMQINMLRMRLQLIQDAVERIDLDKIRLAARLRAKAAGEVAHARNLDINLFERLHKRFNSRSTF
jgi:hypothetical protein